MPDDITNESAKKLSENYGKKHIKQSRKLISSTLLIMTLVFVTYARTIEIKNPRAEGIFIAI